MRLITLILLLTFVQASGHAQGPETHIVKFSETYELANIILALTPYCREDKNEVNKYSAYYREVMTRFDQYSGHPAVQAANYSREAWDQLLSFRTDAVAFAFDGNGKLHRQHKFYAMGKEINAFEDHLPLVEDFARVSGFREFYKEKRPYFDSLRARYESTLFVPEIEAFLAKEFKVTPPDRPQIIVSPLVGRMHCQRTVDGVATSFISIPDYVFDTGNIAGLDEADLAIGLHMFFTEIDHDYVNPASSRYKKRIRRQFDPARWDKGSGYADFKLATFNEYMTWAVYDIFIRQHFPAVADQVIPQWHAINIGRGFFASRLFGEKLQDLYNQKAPDAAIVDLYPDLLNWCMRAENDLDTLTGAQ